jgi:hypothetical protein
MSVQIPKTNVIYSAIEARDKTIDVNRFEKIELIYKLANRGTRRSLNNLMKGALRQALEGIAQTGGTESAL